MRVYFKTTQFVLDTLNIRIKLFEAVSNVSSFTADQLEQVLRERLDAPIVRVEDESYLHAGHAGARAGSHFRVALASPRFVGLSKVKQHRLVYDALAVELQTSIHALALNTYTPEEWSATRSSDRS